MGLINTFIFQMEWYKSNMPLLNLVGALGGEWIRIQSYFIIVSIIIISKVI